MAVVAVVVFVCVCVSVCLTFNVKETQVHIDGYRTAIVATPNRLCDWDPVKFHAEV